MWLLPVARAIVREAGGGRLVDELDRIVLESDAFWVVGGRQPDAVIATDGSQSGLTFQVSNVAIRNRVRVSSGGWSATRELAPDERWLVTVPLGDSTQPAILNFRVEHGAVVDGRLFGCRVSIVQ
jgi:hypothetical protein